MMQHIHKNRALHPDLVSATRTRLSETGKPYIIENVSGAPLKSYFMLCGTMFGLRIMRHRYFEFNFDMPFMVLSCNHADVYSPWNGQGRTSKKFREAMGIDWMNDAGGGKRKGTLSQAVPPAFTEYIGNELRARLSKGSRETAYNKPQVETALTLDL